MWKILKEIIRLTRFIEQLLNCQRSQIDHKRKTANTVDCHFVHANPEKMKKLIKASNISDQELLDIIDIVAIKCQVCLTYKKPKFRPVISFSLSKDFLSQLMKFDITFD